MTQSVQLSQQDKGTMWDALIYRRWLIVLFAILGFCIGLGVVLFKPPVFKASTLVMVQPAPQMMPATSGLPSMSTPPLESFILSQVEILRSQELLQKLADAHPGLSTASLARALEVEPVGRSLLLRVTFKQKEAHNAASLANELVALYLREQTAGRNNDIVKSRDWLEKRLQDLGQDLTKLDNDTAEYRRKHNLDVDLSDSTTLLRAKNIDAELEKARSEATTLELQHKQIETLNPQEQKVFVEAASNVSPMLAGLATEETKLMAERAQLLSQYGDRHPLVLQANARVNAVTGQKSSLIRNFIKNIGQQEKIMQAKVAMLTAEQTAVQEELKRQKSVLVPLTQMQQQKEIKDRLYKKYLSRYQDFLSAEYVAPLDAKVVSKAVPPQKSSDLNAFLLVLMATIAAFLLGIFLALLLDDFTTEKNGDYND